MFRLWQNALLEKVSIAQLLPSAWGGCISYQNVLSPWAWALWKIALLIHWPAPKKPMFPHSFGSPPDFLIGGVDLSPESNLSSYVNSLSCLQQGLHWLQALQFRCFKCTRICFNQVWWNTQTHLEMPSCKFLCLQTLKAEVRHAMWRSPRGSQEAKRAWRQHGQGRVLWFSLGSHAWGRLAGQADLGLAGLNNLVGLEGIETVSSCLVLVPGVMSVGVYWPGV